MLVFPTTLISDIRELQVSLTDGPDRNANNFTNYTYPDQSIGTAPAAGKTRHVVAVAVSDSDDSPNQTITAIQHSPDGIVAYTSMTMLRNEHDNIDGFGHCIAMAIAEFPTGTTSYFRITTSGGTQSNMNLAVYSLIDLRSMTPIETEYSFGDDVTALAFNLDLMGGGVIIGAAQCRNNMDSLTGFTSTANNNNVTAIVGHKTSPVFLDEHTVTALPALAPPFLTVADMNFMAVSLY